MLLDYNVNIMNHIEDKLNTTKGMYTKLFSLKSRILG